MTLAAADCVAAIARHSSGFAASARGNVDARVEHCPDWSVADLVSHLTEVHWFWSTIAEERPASLPDESQRPPRVADAALVDVFEAGAARLVAVLAAADQSAPCWTWAPQQQDVAFITRHQVQEAAVHHWDVVHAAGGSLAIEPDVAVDAIAEFLVFSVATEADAPARTKPSLGGAFAIRATDVGAAWTVRDAGAPGTVLASAGVDGGVPVIESTASELLLWLYGRVEVDTSRVDADVVARFRALCFTD